MPLQRRRRPAGQPAAALSDLKAPPKAPSRCRVFGSSARRRPQVSHPFSPSSCPIRTAPSDLVTPACPTRDVAGSNTGPLRCMHYCSCLVASDLLAATRLRCILNLLTSFLKVKVSSFILNLLARRNLSSNFQIHHFFLSYLKIVLE